MGGLFKTDKPKVTPVSRMPDTEDPAVLEAKKRAAGAAQARSGRASTMLSSRVQAANAPQTSGAGTSAYKSSLLGSAG